MVKKFFGQVLTSFMGTWIALASFAGVAAIVIISIIGVIGSRNEGEKGVTSDSILCLTLEGNIVERETPASLDYPSLLSGSLPKSQALDVLIQGLREGADNKDIKALYIDAKGVSAAPATLNALRDAVVEFKKCGKPVYAYSDNFSQGDYYISSAADKLFLNPMGSVQIHGIAGSVLFYKDLCDKLGITFEVFRVGTYKSAVEPYLLNNMSEPARENMTTLYGGIWNQMAAAMAKSRKLKTAQVDTLVNNIIMLQDADAAKKANLVDSLVTGREMKKVLAGVVGVEEKKLNLVDPSVLASQSGVYVNYDSKNRIAVLYASGEINEATDNGINCYNLVPVIAELAEDDEVKAMVLRVNSPGGSVFGSQEIAEALEYFQSKKKPLVVSMGDYAASGGYWISCEAEKIYADPMTITGSIGIFGLIPNIQGLLSKAGVNVATVSTSPNSISPMSILTPMTDKEKQVMQQSIEKLYDRFIKRVAAGRKLPEAKVRQIAEGRVWLATDALKLGLIDGLGGLDKAIDEAARLAGIAGNENVAAYPRLEPNIWDMIYSAAGDKGYSMLLRVMGRDFDPVLMRAAHDMLSRRRELALTPVYVFDN